MKFEIESFVNSPSCKMRVGLLRDIKRIPNTVLLTPLLLLYSKGGSVPHLTREVLEMVTNITTQAVQIPIANSEQCYNGVKHFKDGISKFVGLPECLTYCTVQDPAEVTKVGYNEKNSITIWTHSGRKQLTPDKYMDIIEAFRPDMYHVLCDGDTSEQTSHRRAQKAVDVSTSMFLTCSARHAKAQSLANSAMLAVVEGGFNLKARVDCAAIFGRQSQVLGFVIDGLHNNGLPVEQMSYESVRPVITETLTHLPQDKLRVVHGGWRPDVVLELVRAGIDVFDSSLVYSITERGCAFTFSYKVYTSKDCNEEHKTVGVKEKRQFSEEVSTENQKYKEDKIQGSDVNNYQINLHEKLYSDDLSPVLSGCTCLACTKHTRAYIHHLLNTKEMLASVLLMIHNLHHYQQFFHAIRENGKKGQFLIIDPPFT